MREATFTELRNHAKTYFDAVEMGETVRIYRNGKPVAEIVPVRQSSQSWKNSTPVPPLKGIDLSREILADREQASA